SLRFVCISFASIMTIKMNNIFFFQAEDGIRDSSVTGVQTCALPIFAAALAGGPVRPVLPELTFRPDPKVLDGRFANNPWLQELRSEERRVGKECRYRRQPPH